MINDRPVQLGSTELDRDPLAGDRLVRFVYLDESGISANEPFVVVAGVIVSADKQWKAVETHIISLVEELIPLDKREGFIFHAKELYSGGGAFDRDLWSKEARWKILDTLLSIPFNFRLPVLMGYSKKDASAHPKTQMILSHALAFGECIVAADQFMVRCAEPDEVAIVTAEDNTQTRRALKITHQSLTRAKPFPAAPMWENAPLTRIIDTVHFAEKHEASLLQIADACAFVLKRHLTRAANNERFLQALFGGSYLPVELGRMLRYPGGAYCFHAAQISHFVPAHKLASEPGQAS